MATEFKSYAVADISANAGTPTDVIDNAQIGASRYGVLIGILFSNKSAATRLVTLMIEKNGGDTVEIASALSLPPNVSFEFMEGNKIVLETGDVLSCYSDATTSVDIIASVMINDA